MESAAGGLRSYLCPTPYGDHAALSVYAHEHTARPSCRCLSHEFRLFRRDCSEYYAVNAGLDEGLHCFGVPYAASEFELYVDGGPDGPYGLEVFLAAGERAVEVNDVN